MPFSTVTRRTPDMSRTNCSPSRMTSTRRGLGAGGAGVAVGDLAAFSAGGVPVLLAVLEFLLRGARGTRTGRARSGFSAGGVSVVALSFRSLLAGVSVSPSFAFSAFVLSAPLPVFGFGELLRAVSAREVPRVPVLARAGRGLAGDFFATTGGGGSRGSAVCSASFAATSATGSSMRAPVEVTRLTFRSALLTGVGERRVRGVCHVR